MRGPEGRCEDTGTPRQIIGGFSPNLKSDNLKPAIQGSQGSA